MNDSGNPEQQHPGSGEVASADAAKTPLPAQPATEQQLYTAEQQIEERMSAFERSMVRLTRYGLAVTILTGIIFAGQLYEMISGGTQTDKLIRYARTQANAASDQADAAQQFSDTTEDINGRMSDAVEQLEAAAKNAKASIEATQKSFRADQRAWVGLGEAQILQFNAKDALKLAVPMVDTGKSPAVSTEGALKYLVTSAYRKGPPINAQYLFKPASAVPPQGRYVFNVTQAGISDSYDAITSGTKFLYIYGVFRYRDVYDPAVARVTTFCLFYDITYKGMAFCETGNGMN